MILLDKTYVCKAVELQDVWLESAEGNTLTIKDDCLLALERGQMYHVVVEALSGGNYALTIRGVYPQ